VWPNNARVALWINPNVEFFALDDAMPGNNNERVARDHAHVPNVRNWSVRDYGNRVGVWRLMETLTRYGLRGTAALNSEVCNHHPEVIAEMVRLGWELMGHNETNALRLTEMKARGGTRFDSGGARHDREGERPAARGLAGRRSCRNLAHTGSSSEGGVRYVCDWVNDDQPYTMDIGEPRMVSLPYSVQINDVPAYFDYKQSVPEFEADDLPSIRRALSRRRAVRSGDGHSGASVRDRAGASHRRARAGPGIHLFA